MEGLHSNMTDEKLKILGKFYAKAEKVCMEGCATDIYKNNLKKVRC